LPTPAQQATAVNDASLIPPLSRDSLSLGNTQERGLQQG
jgi:hypothetical protein